ncbi:S-methyl-5-thioribose-1-phosphate isomerase [bacterium]|nr:S-methyl-5-thioribose-1-phosphate isomerase [bacterium]
MLSSLPFYPAWWSDNCYKVLDQLALPSVVREIECHSADDIFLVIQKMEIRGAPLIGVAASAAFAFALRDMGTVTPDRVAEFVLSFSKARPTAVNLYAVLNYMENAMSGDIAAGQSPSLLFAKAQDISVKLHRADRERNRKMGEYGADYFSTLFDKKISILTHCNTGSLATAGYGTALGVIRSLFERDMIEMVWVDETRPYLQGARLTAWELEQEGIPYTIITDSTAAWLMKLGRVDAVIVGADRMAKNGDFANKIGSYGLAVAAQWHKIPFMTALPVETIDISIDSGESIPIEQRDSSELLSCGGSLIAPSQAEGLHIGFDVVPANLLSAIITEKGVLYEQINAERVVDLYHRSPSTADGVHNK